MSFSKIIKDFDYLSIESAFEFTLVLLSGPVVFEILPYEIRLV